MLRRPDLTPEQREKLEVVRLARRYAEEVIGLRETAAYTLFLDTGGRALAWNLSACPKDRLQARTWRFPLVGEVPYLGFLDEGEARSWRRELERQGYDTDLRPVNAWSSLGWFADPLTSGMLEGTVASLSEVILHELTHATIFLRGEVAFNESLAVFVGSQGTLNFLARLYGPLSPEVQGYQEALGRRRRFHALLEDLWGRLQRLYASSLPREEKLRRRELEFSRAQQRYRELIPDASQWTRFARQPLNNAVLLNYGRYNRGLRFHEQVYDRLGRDLGRLVRLYVAAQRYPDPIGRVAELSGLPRPAGQRH